MSTQNKVGVLIACAATSAAGWADEARRELSAGVLLTVSLADGEPANDIPGFGAQLRYELTERWAVGGTLLRSEYDFETPAAIAGITQSPAVEAVDALAESTMLQGWVERTFRPRSAVTTWFVGTGAGAASVKVPDVSGPRDDGGQFDVRTDVGTEILISAFAGLRRSFGDRWYAEFRIHANQHLADWKVEDLESGATGSIDDYTTFGGHLAFGRRW